MKKMLILVSVVIGMSCSPAISDEAKILVTSKTLSLDAALKVAQTAIKACNKDGYQIAVAVVDIGGNTQVLLRNRYAGIFATKVALGKARTALSFRMNTEAFQEATKPGNSVAPIRLIPGVVALGGGVIVQAAGKVVGAVGIHGAPSGKLDEACALKGVEVIQEDLDF